MKRGWVRCYQGLHCWRQSAELAAAVWHPSKERFCSPWTPHSRGPPTLAHTGARQAHRVSVGILSVAEPAHLPWLLGPCTLGLCLRGCQTPQVWSSRHHGGKGPVRGDIQYRNWHLGVEGWAGSEF